MIVCLCSGENYKNIVEYVKNGFDTLRALQTNYNICSDCKKCLKQVEKILKGELGL